MRPTSPRVLGLATLLLIPLVPEGFARARIHGLGEDRRLELTPVRERLREQTASPR